MYLEFDVSIARQAYYRSGSCLSQLRPAAGEEGGSNVRLNTSSAKVIQTNKPI
jgi:hypothetical protein